MSRRSAVAAAVLVTAALVGLALHRRGGSPGAGRPAADAAPPPLEFQLRDGTSKAYALALTTTFLPAGPGALARETSFTGRLNLRVERAAAATALVLQLSPLEVRIDGARQAALEAALAAPFRIAIDARGQLGEARFPAELAPADRAVLDGAIRAFQVVLSPEPAARWEAREADQTGTFVAAYRRGDARGALVKQKLRYASLRPGAPFAIRVLGSAIHAEVDASGPWLRRVDGTERLAFDAGPGQSLATADARFTLEPAAAPPERTLALWRPLDPARLVGLEAPARTWSSAWDDAERERARNRFVRQGVTLDALVARAAHDPRDAALAEELGAFLRVFTPEAAQLPRRLRRVDDETAALLVHALELAGTPEAQRALADVMEARDQSRANRLRALVAMTGLERPTPDTLDRLGRAAREGDGAGGEVASTALLALGALAPRAPAARGGAIVEGLSDDLRDERDPQRRRLLLLALENAGATLPGDVVRAESASPSAGVREVAARMLGRDPAASATPELVVLLAREPSPEVRAAIVQALLARPPDGQANAAIARALSEGREPDAALRGRMVTYLAAQMQSYPANRDVLRSRLRAEPDRGVVVAILNALAR